MSLESLKSQLRMHSFPTRTSLTIPPLQNLKNWTTASNLLKWTSNSLSQTFVSVTPGPSNDSADSEDSPDGTVYYHTSPSIIRTYNLQSPPTNMERAQSMSCENTAILYVGNSQSQYLNPSKIHRVMWAEVHNLREKHQWSHTILLQLQPINDTKSSRATNYIVICVPLPRLWATADITGRYSLCHD